VKDYRLTPDAEKDLVEIAEFVTRAIAHRHGSARRHASQ
jgi:hypothetical protein